MARGWHYAKLSLSNALRLSFSGMCILLFLFLSLCRFCLFVFFFCSHWSLVDVPLIFFCPADHVVPDWQPRILLGMFEARSVNVKKTTTKLVRGVLDLQKSLKSLEYFPNFPNFPTFHVPQCGNGQAPRGRCLSISTLWKVESWKVWKTPILYMFRHSM